MPILLEMCWNQIFLLNIMISGFGQNKFAKDALSLFHQMQLKGVEPDRITVVAILHSCAELAAEQKGKEIHGYIIITRLVSDVSIIAALVAMYKRGNIESASQLFNTIVKKCGLLDNNYRRLFSVWSCQ